MRVYLLEDMNHDITVFSSYSAMLIHVKTNFSNLKFIDKSIGRVVIDGDFDLWYKVFDVIGEHSVTTDKIEFK